MSNEQIPTTIRKLWSAQDLAGYLGVSVHWVYKRTQRGAEDPPPRCRGIKRLRFNPQDKAFQAWLERQIGAIDFDYGSV